MFPGESVPGRQRGWRLTKKLGEGDAGEVFLVESLLDKKVGILKRPHRSAFSSDIIRQATQIETEGKVLRTLEGVSVSSGSVRFSPPSLLDTSKPGTEFSERFFIVIEKAPGLDLNLLARAARFGADDPAIAGLENGHRLYIQALARRGEVPALILLRALAGLIDLFEAVHIQPAHFDGEDHQGILWNDVKPDHIFWDPAHLQVTVIDWGNGRFLEADGATRDRAHSRWNDYAQFIQEMGNFLSSANPALHARLEWPANIIPGFASTETIQNLKERICGLMEKEMEGLKAARDQENELIQSADPAFDLLSRLDSLQEQIASFGELPNYAGIEKFSLRLASRLVGEGKMQELGQLCTRTAQLPGATREKWSLLSVITQTALLNPAEDGWFQALSYALSDDWANALWELFALAAPYAEQPAWWAEISSQVRQMQLQLDSNALTPFTTLNRLTYTLESSLRQGSLPPAASDEPESIDPSRFYEKLVLALREEVLPRWKELEPDPPDSGLEYSDVDRLAEELGAWLPEAAKDLVRTLDQPRAQAKLVLEAWNRKEFETARRGLRRLLLWDPDRRRVWTAERLTLAAPAWLEQAYRGPKNGEMLHDFVSRMELRGRDFRNQVGPARWLELILEALMQVRKGTYPGDLTLGSPDLVNEMPWLLGYEPRRTVFPTNGKAVRLDREPGPAAAEPTLRGTEAGRLGQDRDLLLADPLDAWASEAVGSSARVYNGFLRSTSDVLRQAAIKVMRPDQPDYALPLFREEVQVLNRLRDVPGITGMLECGFIRLDEGKHFPAEEVTGDARTAVTRDLTGRVLRFSPDEAAAFLEALEPRVQEEWVPYLALEKRRWEDNLLLRCDSGYTRGRLPAVNECLRLALQICDLIEVAHARNIVYRDHKILHYYWLEEYNGVFMIDWNVAQLHPQGLSKTEKQFDLVQFGARALHHILTGRVAPGALPLGPTRPEEIEAAARTYPVRWTYDDLRLPDRVKEIVEIVLSGGYNDVKALRDDLYAEFVKVNGEEKEAAGAEE